MLTLIIIYAVKVLVMNVNFTNMQKIPLTRKLYIYVHYIDKKKIIFYSVIFQSTDPDCYLLVTMSKRPDYMTTTFPTTTTLSKTTTEESFSA